VVHVNSRLPRPFYACGSNLSNFKLIVLYIHELAKIERVYVNCGQQKEMTQHSEPEKATKGRRTIETPTAPDPVLVVLSGALLKQSVDCMDMGIRQESAQSPQLDPASVPPLRVHCNPWIHLVQ
jgi:hypothetical protein